MKNKEVIKSDITFIEAYIEKNGNATEAYLAISPKVTKIASVFLAKNTYIYKGCFLYFIRVIGIKRIDNVILWLLFNHSY